MSKKHLVGGCFDDFSQESVDHYVKLGHKLRAEETVRMLRKMRTALVRTRR